MSSAFVLGSWSLFLNKNGAHNGPAIPSLSSQSHFPRQLCLRARKDVARILEARVPKRSPIPAEGLDSIACRVGRSGRWPTL